MDQIKLENGQWQMQANFTVWLTCADVGQHKALATPGNSEHIHRDEPRPNLQPYSGIGWLVTQLSLKVPWAIKG